jgi:hypothetical protein
MGLFDNLTYAFSGSAPAGDPGSPQALETRRKIAIAMLGRDRKGYPKNVGEGLTAIGDALGERSQLAQLDAQQAAYDKWNIEHPPPSASSLMQQTNPPAAATGPRAEASPQMPPIAPAVADASPVPAAAAPLLQAAANNDAYQPADALPPVADAGGAPQLASADTGTMSDAAPVGAPTGQPNPAAVRASIAQLMQARQGGPQPNPMLAGQQPASAPSDLSPDPSLLGSPLKPNRPIETDIKPVQVAQAAGTAPDIPEINQVWPPVAAPKPGPVQQPPNAPYNQMELKGADLEQWGNQRGDPRAIAQGQLLQKLGKEQRDRENADLQEKYRLDRQQETQRILEQERAQQGKGVAQKQLEEAGSKAAVAAAGADIVKRTGKTPDVFWGNLDTEKSAVDQIVKGQNAQQLARAAIRDGVITGYGSSMKVAAAKFADWALKNGLQGDYASNTEIMRASLQAGLKQAIETINGVGGRVTDRDLAISQDLQGTNPELQMKTIKTLMDRAAEINNTRINRYEDLVHNFLGEGSPHGVHPQASYYATNPLPTAPGDKLKMFLDTQKGDPGQAALHKIYFDQAYGPGSADLEIARAKRAARRSGGQ